MNTEKIKMDRRTFLKTTAIAGAGISMATAMTGRAAGSSSDDLNVAIIGAGEQGQVLVNTCLKIPGIRFKAVCDIWEAYNLRKVSRMLKAYKHTVNSYVDYKEMLATETDLDAVIIATPDFWHAQQTVDCLNAGLNVYCEKEMSNTIEGAKQMVLAARETGKLLQIGHQRRSNPRYQHCYDKIINEADLVGRITNINGQWNRSAKPLLGWPEKASIDTELLNKFGFEDMQQFRNWRWYKGLGGGPIVDLGSHQIDIYNWFLDTKPSSVMASGGTDYYDPKTHQWYDNVLAIYEYPTPKGMVRAYYQTLTTNSNGGYYETFMGDQGTLFISESSSRGGIYREPSSPDWEKWVKAGIITEPVAEKKPEKTEDSGSLLDVRETEAPPAYGINATMDKKYHQPHLENFFDAVRGKTTLNCPPEIGFESAVTVLKVNEAIEKGEKLTFSEEDFVV
ncbi:MAG: Gfo/Idh/MocA family oxidoreductase [Sedimentisphaeraceae bacterium JB056]